MSVTLKVEEFASALNLKIANRGRGTITVDSSDLNRPGLQFSGFFVHFAFERIQLVGNSEIQYLLEMETQTLQSRAETLMSYNIPALICARGWQPLETLLSVAREHDVPVLVSDRTTTQISHATTNYLERMLAPTITQHGVLLDVYGVGIMLTGESGLGKSEAALEMIKRGHRLVADDVVEITRVAENRLSGRAPELTRYLMEIRGIGIIDVRYMYGVGAIIMEKSIDIIMEMELWQEGKPYDRLGTKEETVSILDVNVPKILMPVRPGRNMAVVIEVAARNFRLKRMGYDAASEFDKRWLSQFEKRDSQE